MKNIFLKIIFVIVITLVGYISYAGYSQIKMIFEPKIITTNYDSLAPFLKYNGWEKLTDKEKVDWIIGWKKFINQRDENHGPMPDEGVVKNEEIAIRIAELYLHGMYGDEIYFFVPYVAVKQNDSVWHVAGTPPPGWHGSIIMDIDSRDGRVLAIGKGK